MSQQQQQQQQQQKHEDEDGRKNTNSIEQSSAVPPSSSLVPRKFSAEYLTPKRRGSTSADLLRRGSVTSRGVLSQSALAAADLNEGMEGTASFHSSFDQLSDDNNFRNSNVNPDQHLLDSITSPTTTPLSFYEEAATFLPMYLRRAFDTPDPSASPLPSVSSLLGTIMIADLSGFTALGSSLTISHGTGEGAALLAEAVDDVLTKVVCTVTAFGGDVIKFAGDAVICAFGVDGGGGGGPPTGEGGDAQRLLEKSREDARRCAVALLRASRESENNRLEIHGAIGSGSILFLRLGKESGLPGTAMFLVAGSALEAAGRLVDASSPGQFVIESDQGGAPVVIDLSYLPSITPGFDVGSCGGPNGDEVGNYDYEQVVSSSCDLPPEATSYLSTLCEKRLRSLLVESSLALTDDIRKCSVVFISLPDLKNDFEKNPDGLNVINQAFQILTKNTYKYDGTCRDFLFDDKGCVYIAVFGATQRGECDDLAAVQSAQSIVAALKKELGLELTRGGVSSGNVFVGLCGPSFRSDCIVMGGDVNMAARLSAKAGHGVILVSPKVYKATKEKIEYEPGPHLALKGIGATCQSYIPKTIIEEPTAESTAISNNSWFAGRDAEIEAVLEAVSDSGKAVTSLCLVVGESGMGKSALTQHVIQKLRGDSNSNAPMLFSAASSLKKYRSYYIFEAIFRQLLPRLLHADSFESINFKSRKVEHLFATPTDRSILSVIVPELATETKLKSLGISAAAMTAKLHRIVLDMLMKVGRCILFIEDGIWLDMGSLSLIRYIVEQSEDAVEDEDEGEEEATHDERAEHDSKGDEKQARQFRIMPSRPSAKKPVFVINCRPTTTTDDNYGTWWSWAAGLNDATLCRVIPLERLEKETIGKIILHELDSTDASQLDEKLLSTMAQASAGSPLAAKIYVKWGLEHNLINHANGIFFIGRNADSLTGEGKGLVDLDFPESFVAAIAARVDHLPVVQSDILKVAVCIGHKFAPDIIVPVLLTSAEVVNAALKELVSGHILVAEGDGIHFSFAQHAIFLVILDSLSGSQRAKIASDIVECLHEHLPDIDASTSAGHYEAAGNIQAAVIFFENAATKSAERMDFHSSVEYLLRAIQLCLDVLQSQADSGKIASWPGLLATQTERGAKRQDRRRRATKETSEVRTPGGPRIKRLSLTCENSPASKLIAMRLALVDMLRLSANYAEAEKHCKLCLSFFEMAVNAATFVSYHAETLSATAMVYKEKGDYDVALPFSEEAMALAELHFESSDRRLARIYAQHAELLRKKGSNREALDLHMKALGIRNDLVLIASVVTDAAPGGSPRDDGEKLDIAESYTAVGCCLTACGAVAGLSEKPVEMHEKALGIRIALLHSFHPLTSESLNYIGESLLLDGRPSSALPYLLNSYSIRIVAFGSNHPAVAHVLGLLASSLAKLGRCREAERHFQNCTRICEIAFKPTHPNLIPNLFAYGKLLFAMKKYAQAKSILDRALSIHLGAGRSGGVEVDIRNYLGEIDVVQTGDGRDVGETSEGNVDKGEDESDPYIAKMESARAVDHNVLLFTDPGRDLDDELSFVTLAAMHKQIAPVRVRTVGVIASLMPTIVRARLARGSLDVLGLADVPVGFGLASQSHKNITYQLNESDRYISPEVFAADYPTAETLLLRIYNNAEKKSISVHIIATMTDIAAFIKAYPSLFAEKTKNAVIMGGVMPYKGEEGELLMPDSAYNNHCDVEAARFVHETFQNMRIPMIIVTRHCAYACKLFTTTYSALVKTGNAMARRLEREQRSSIFDLWKRAVASEGSPERQELPDRCNREWFCDTFTRGKVLDKNVDESELWASIDALLMYDPLSIVAGIDGFREIFFEPKKVEVHGIVHEIIGENDSNCGIKAGQSDALRGAMVELFMSGMALPSLAQLHSNSS